MIKSFFLRETFLFTLELRLLLFLRINAVGQQQHPMGTMIEELFIDSDCAE
jgi:hypothetical protein